MGAAKDLVVRAITRQEADAAVKWLITFADGAQCGDGTIYRAAGFVLTGIKPNNQVWVLPSQAKVSRVSVTKGQHIVSRSSMTMLGPKGAGKQQRSLTATGLLQPTGGASMKSLAAAGARPLPGFQLRYLYFLDPTARQRLTVPILPFSEIERRGAGMHRGKPRAGSSVSGTVVTPGDRGRCESDPGA